VFFRARDPRALKAWYRQHLGIEPGPDGTVQLWWREFDAPERPGHTVWAPFPADTPYFGEMDAQLMINYRVDDLDAMLAALREAGVSVDPKIEESEFGRFGWATDPEGNRFELWQPPEGQ
jgi:predicted enzyme related to lactoylglutathione lyase